MGSSIALLITEKRPVRGLTCINHVAFNAVSESEMSREISGMEEGKRLSLLKLEQMDVVEIISVWKSVIVVSVGRQSVLKHLLSARPSEIKRQPLSPLLINGNI